MDSNEKSSMMKLVDAYKKEKGLKDVGIPASGNNYRFLIIDRYGKDLQKIFQTGKKTFAPKAAYNLAIRCLDALEYIHAQGYVHNDLKAQNLLLGHGRSKENDVFLVDFGLVSKYKVNGVHLEYKPDARRAHDGTIEYTSRDAHIGAHSRRSDLEILGYNLVHWMSGHLPWMNNLTNPVYVHTQKKGFMSDIPSFLRNCFGDENKYPDVLEKFLNYTVGLEFDTKPDYDLCRSLFKDELRRLRLPSDGKIDFSSSSRSSQKKVGNHNLVGGKKQQAKQEESEEEEAADESMEIDDETEEEEEEFKTPRSRRRNKTHLVDTGVQTSPAFVKAARTAAKKKKEGGGRKRRDSSSDEEMSAFIKKSKAAAKKALNSAPKKRKKQSDDDSNDGLDNPTPAMLAIMQKRKQSKKTNKA
ncbi:Uncharacterized protein FKW44_014914 [Caligus rogercresseyi]|uniref:non-specific serine/threonine protein kinase n=1 Tax=Caligus rogercresseyi TaxID=217165 RepID=A0A7T8H094_CALRO|nr:Uncharacterized protein FKW44_014914 [Caligus rogercresseyi]